MPQITHKIHIYTKGRPISLLMCKQRTILNKKQSKTRKKEGRGEHDLHASGRSRKMRQHITLFVLGTKNTATRALGEQPQQLQGETDSKSRRMAAIHFEQEEEGEANMHKYVHLQQQEVIALKHHGRVTSPCKLRHNQEPSSDGWWNILKTKWLSYQIPGHSPSLPVLARGIGVLLWFLPCGMTETGLMQARERVG